MLLNRFTATRQRTERICSSLKTDDYVVQPVADVSPPKWHLGHTTWFFETLILKPYAGAYREYNPAYNFIFSEGFDTHGTSIPPAGKCNLNRPTVEEVYQYRSHVDKAIQEFLSDEVNKEKYRDIVTLAINHEEQHQELLYTDIKYILGHNPLFPSYIEDEKNIISGINADTGGFINMPEGIYSIGFKGNGFCFDNELERHNVFLRDYAIRATLVTNAEYLDFMNDGGYLDFRHWLSEGWRWVKDSGATAPLYWHRADGQWMNYTLYGFEPVNADEPVCHVNYYEAHAFAAWRGQRLPTEFEWEAAADSFAWGKRWEWTESAYLPYPGYKKPHEPLGEYSGQFMISQMVIRGASEVTPPGYRRSSYRGFLYPRLRLQYTGIRLAKRI